MELLNNFWITDHVTTSYRCRLPAKVEPALLYGITAIGGTNGLVESVRRNMTGVCSLSDAIKQVPNVFTLLLDNFADVTQAAIPKQLPCHSVRHHIITRGSSFHYKSRRLAPDKFKVARIVFDNLVQLNITQPSSSGSSELHMVSKCTKHWSHCGCYRVISVIRLADRYPSRNI